MGGYGRLIYESNSRLQFFDDDQEVGTVEFVPTRAWSYVFLFLSDYVWKQIYSRSSGRYDVGVVLMCYMFYVFFFKLLVKALYESDRREKKNLT